jgi:hypothetical protein
VIFTAYYRRAWDGQCPAEPDIVRDYDEGACVDAASKTEACAFISAGRRHEGCSPRRAAMPLRSGDILVDETGAAWILSPLGVLSTVALKKSQTR